MWNETDLAYLAGIIDGEGHIRAVDGPHPVDGRRRRDISLIVTQGNQHLALLRHLHEKFGGRIYHQGPTAHKWELRRGEDLHQLLSAVAPYLVLKKETALRALVMLEAGRWFIQLKAQGLTFHWQDKPRDDA